MNLPVMWHDELSREERIPILYSEREYLAFWLTVLAVQGCLNLVIGIGLIYLAVTQP